MTTNKTKKNPSQQQPELFRSADFKSLYTNFAQTSASPADISLVVGEASPSESGTAIVEMKARLVMAPIQAKVLLGMLAHVIQQYETQFGQIVIPDAVLSQLTFAIPMDEKSLTEGV
jgi:hypothetical protein